MNFNLKQEASRLSASGLNVLPAGKATKRPVEAWQAFRTQRRPVDGAFDRCDAIAVVCGVISGNVEIIDFDAQAVDFDDWCQRVAELDANAAQTLFSCVLETTQNGGKHLAYRCESPVDGNLKLTTRNVDGAVKTTIETRGEGGIVIVAPTAGYSVVRGDWASLPVVSAATRQTFLDAARSLSDAPQTTERRDLTFVPRDDSIADWMRTRGYLQRALVARGWRYVETRGDNEHWRRPGKTDGVSGTLSLEKQCFYVFSSNASPLEPNRAYSALQLVAAFDFDGDERAAARYYLNERDALETPRVTVDFSLDKTSPTVGKPPKQTVCEVAFPVELLDAPGLIGDIMRYIESQEQRPQPALRFAGALALTSHLIARKLSAFGGQTRGNLQIIGIAEAGGGKDAARSANTRILTACGAEVFPDQYKSASAFWRTLGEYGAVFSQIDEFGLFLRAINDDGGHLNRLASAFMQAFSASKFERYVPPLGVSEKVAPVVFPSFTAYGTTTMTEFADAMTEKQLANGFLARCTIIEGDKNAKRNFRDFEDYVAPPPSEGLVTACRTWLDYRRVLACETPTAFDVPITRSAKKLLRDVAERVDALQTARGTDDAIKTFFARLDEKNRKYALIFAAAQHGPDETALKIDDDNAALAAALTNYEIEYFQRFISVDVATGAEEKRVKDAEKWLQTLADKTFTRSEFTRKYQHWGRRERDDALQTLVDLGVVEKTIAQIGKTAKTIFNVVN